MKKLTFVKPGRRRPFPGGVLIEERGEMGATACTMDSYRSIIQGVLLGMALGAAYLLSGCATGSGVYGIPVQGERIVFVLDISGSMENKTEDTATGRAAYAITNAAEAELNKHVPPWLTRIGREEFDRQTTKLAGAKRQLIPTINNLPHDRDIQRGRFWDWCQTLAEELGWGHANTERVCHCLFTAALCERKHGCSQCS